MGNWRIVRYADDFVIMTNGSRDDAATLKEQAAEVLAGRGLRFSEAKTRITHLSEGIDFLGFRLQWRKRRGGGKWYCMTFIAGKAFASIKQAIRNLRPRTSTRPAMTSRPSPPSPASSGARSGLTTVRSA